MVHRFVRWRGVTHRNEIAVSHIEMSRVTHVNEAYHNDKSQSRRVTVTQYMTWVEWLVRDKSITCSWQVTVTTSRSHTVHDLFFTVWFTNHSDLFFTVCHEQVIDLSRTSHSQSHSTWLVLYCVIYKPPWLALYCASPWLIKHTIKNLSVRYCLGSLLTVPCSLLCGFSES